MDADKRGDPIDDDQVRLVVEVFRMLADPTLVRLLWTLVDDELSVNELAGRIDKPAAPGQPSSTARTTSTSNAWSSTRYTTLSTPGRAYPPTTAPTSRYWAPTGTEHGGWGGDDRPEHPPTSS